MRDSTLLQVIPALVQKETKIWYDTLPDATKNNKQEFLNSFQTNFKTKRQQWQAQSDLWSFSSQEQLLKYS